MTLLGRPPAAGGREGSLPALPFACAALLAIAVWLAYWPILSAAFLNWDDRQNFLTNYAFRSLDMTSLSWAWTTDWLGVYQPLTWMAYELEYALFGLQPFGYHVINLLTHTLATLLLFLLTHKLISSRPSVAGGGQFWLAAMFGSCVIMVHPLRSEVVGWISCQGYLFCAVWGLTALLLYVKGASATGLRYLIFMGLAWAAYVVSLLFKVVFVSLPLVLLLLDVYPLGRLATRRRSWLLCEKSPFLLVSLPFLGLGAWARSSGINPIMAANGLERAVMVAWRFTFLGLKTLFPINLSPYYARAVPLDVLSSPLCFALPVVFFAALGLWLIRKKAPSAGAAAIAAALIYLPNLGWIDVGRVVAADRYTYFPSLALAVLASAGVGRILPSSLAGDGIFAWRRWMFAGVVLFCVVLIALTRAQSWIWTDSEQLWQRAMAVADQPDADIYYELGSARMEKQRQADAKSLFQRALALEPHHREAHMGMGRLAFERHDLDEAIVEFRAAAIQKPVSSEALHNLGLSLLGKGMHAEAIAYLKEAVRLKEGFMQGWALLGLAQLEAGDPAAETSLRRALALDPDNRNVSRNLGVLFYRQQRLTEAVHQFQRLAELDPDDSEVLVALAAMLDDAGRYPEAISVLRKAGVLQPTSGEIKADLGIALVHLGELPAAKSALFDALERLSAEHQRTTELASLLVRKGQGASVLALMAERGQATPRLTPYLAAIRAALSAVSPEG